MRFQREEAEGRRRAAGPPPVLDRREGLDVTPGDILVGVAASVACSSASA